MGNRRASVCKARKTTEERAVKKEQTPATLLDPFGHGIKATTGLGDLRAAKGPFSHDFRATRGNAGNIGELVNTALKAIRSRGIYRNVGILETL